MPKPELVDIAVMLKHETKSAYLVNDGTQDVWLPKSQCEFAQLGNDGVVTLPLWLAKEKGLI